MIRAMLFGLLGLASFVGVYTLMLDREADVPPAASPPPTPVAKQAAAPVAAVEFELRPGTELPTATADEPRIAPEPAIAVETALEETAPPRAIRNVTPSNMTAAPELAGTPTRVALPAPEKPKPQARRERLFNPIVLAAGAIKVQRREVRFAGIDAPAFDERCGEGADAWPCGRMARAALRGFIRGRAVECEVPAGAEDIPDPAYCSVGGDDIAEWLVAQGWAKPQDATFEAEADRAREEKLGLWGDARPDIQAAEFAAGG